MYTLGQVTFEDVPGFNATGPAAIITTPADSSLPGLAVVAGLALAVWFFLRRGRGKSFVGRAFGDAPKRRRKNPRRRRRNVLVWGG